MTVFLFVILLALGMVTGFYSGLIGTGGNIILIPALDLLFSYYNLTGAESVKFIIAHSLFITVFLGVAVSYKQYKIGNFYLREILIIGIPGMGSAYILSEFIKSSNWYDKFYFDLIFLTVLVALAVRLFFTRPKEKESIEMQSRDVKTVLPLVGLGVFTGCVTALSGMGGGVILIPFLTDILKVPIKRASSISIGVILFLAVAVSSSYLLVKGSQHVVEKLPMQIGYLSMYIVLPIGIGIFAASAYGVRVAQRTAPLTLRIIFGIIVSILCVKITVGLLLK